MGGSGREWEGGSESTNIRVNAIIMSALLSNTTVVVAQSSAFSLLTKYGKWVD